MDFKDFFIFNDFYVTLNAKLNLNSLIFLDLFIKKQYRF